MTSPCIIINTSQQNHLPVTNLHLRLETTGHRSRRGFLVYFSLPFRELTLFDFHLKRDFPIPTHERSNIEFQVSLYRFPRVGFRGNRCLRPVVISLYLLVIFVSPLFNVALCPFNVDNFGVERNSIFPVASNACKLM